MVLKDNIPHLHGNPADWWPVDEKDVTRALYNFIPKELSHLTNMCYPRKCYL